MNEWVSIRNRVPSTNQRPFLVYFEDGSYGVATYFPSGTNTHYRGWHTGRIGQIVAWFDFELFDRIGSAVVAKEAIWREDLPVIDAELEAREGPSLLDLAGINPDICGDEEPEEFLRRTRTANEEAVRAKFEREAEAAK